MKEKHAQFDWPPLQLFGGSSGYFFCRRAAVPVIMQREVGCGGVQFLVV